MKENPAILTSSPYKLEFDKALGGERWLTIHLKGNEDFLHVSYYLKQQNKNVMQQVNNTSINEKEMKTFTQKHKTKKQEDVSRDEKFVNDAVCIYSNHYYTDSKEKEGWIKCSDVMKMHMKIAAIWKKRATIFYLIYAD